MAEQLPTPPSINPIFPEDVEREIFETAIRLYPNEFPSFVFVARRVQCWVEAVRFEVVLHYGHVKAPLGIALTPFKRNTKHVRHILIGALDLHLNKEMLQSLPDCTNIDDLGIWTDNLHGVFSHCESLRPRRISMALDALFPSPGFGDAYLGFFSRLTHLEVVNVCETWEEWQDFKKIPQLTHLSLVTNSGEEVILGVLRECAKLKVLALVQQNFGTKANPDGLPCAHDPTRLEESDYRIVSFLCDFEADWEAFARGGKCMWNMAEEIVAKRVEEKEQKYIGA